MKVITTTTKISLDHCLLLVLLGNAEVDQLVSVLAGSNHTEVVADLLLLQVLLGEVLANNERYYYSYLQVSLGEIAGGSHGDLGIAAGNSNGGAEVIQLVVDLNVLLQVVFLSIKRKPYFIRKRLRP